MKFIVATIPFIKYPFLQLFFFVLYKALLNIL